MTSLPDGVLQIRRTKFGKSRLLPLHPTAASALDRYLEQRRRLAVTDDHVFLSAGNQRIASSTGGVYLPPDSSACRNCPHSDTPAAHS